MMPRERLSGLTGVQRALGQLQSRDGGSGLDVWLREVQDELNALVRAASGQGEVSDAAIDQALLVADAAATGRPAIGPGPYPVVGSAHRSVAWTWRGPVSRLGPRGPTTGGISRAAPHRCRPVAARRRTRCLRPTRPTAAAAAAGAGGIVACQTLRTAAGVSQGINDMIRAAECWTRTPTWPGWGAQSLEALDWATNLAAIERNCTALSTALDSVRELGPRLAAGGLTPAVTALARRAESDERRLRAQSLCR